MIPVQATAWGAENAELRHRVLSVGHATGVQYRELLQLLLDQTQQLPHYRTSPAEAKQALSNQSRKIAACVTELVGAAETLKGERFS